MAGDEKDPRHGSPAAPHLVPHGDTRCRVCGKNVMLKTFTKEGKAQ